MIQSVSGDVFLAIFFCKGIHSLTTGSDTRGYTTYNTIHY